jgi:uncharacterized phage-associated protein
MSLIELNKSKIGNLIVLLSEKVNPIKHKELIKLLYLIDERAVHDGGIPITWLDHKVWGKGPVAPVIFDMKYPDKNIFAKYAEVKKDASGNIISKNADFDNSEFSDYELKIIDEVVRCYGGKSFEELSGITHQDDSPWMITKKKYSIADNEDSEQDIDLTIVLKGDENKIEIYKEARSIMEYKAKIAS